jgi:hypothetical protein
MEPAAGNCWRVGRRALLLLEVPRREMLGSGGGPMEEGEGDGGVGCGSDREKLGTGCEGRVASALGVVCSSASSTVKVGTCIDGGGGGGGGGIIILSLCNLAGASDCPLLSTLRRDAPPEFLVPFTKLCASPPSPPGLPLVAAVTVAVAGSAPGNAWPKLLVHHCRNHGAAIHVGSRKMTQTTEATMSEMPRRAIFRFFGFLPTGRKRSRSRSLASDYGANSCSAVDMGKLLFNLY